MLIKDQFGNIQNLQTSPIPQTSFLVGTGMSMLDQKTPKTITRYMEFNQM